MQFMLLQPPYELIRSIVAVVVKLCIVIHAEFCQLRTWPVLCGAWCQGDLKVLKMGYFDGDQILIRRKPKDRWGFAVSTFVDHLCSR